MEEKTCAAFKSFALPLLGSIFSGVLLALAFPGFVNPSLAYVGLVPLMFAVRKASAKKAAWLGLLAGFVFFLVSLSWLHNLTGKVEGVGLKASALLGYAVLAFYCALYFIPPALTVSACVRRWGLGSWWKNLRLMFSVSMVWVASEYLRGVLFTGFPWNPLGVSQYGSPALIQIAQWGGVHVVSACIVWMNAALFVTFCQYVQGLRSRKYRPHVELMLGLLPLALSASYGLRIVFNQPVFPEPVHVALIQPNIMQTAKWDREKEQEIRARLGELTGPATHLDGIDLIIWPETALPDYIRHPESSQSRELVAGIVAEGVPLLVGTMDFAFSGSDPTYYNSSILFETNNIGVTKYDKQHLVPFGEYVPLPGLMSKFTPVQGDLCAGAESTIFSLRGKAPFSVLICFEDTVAPLSAKAVRNGARWLVNQTNDGWFDPSAQSVQHLAHAVFRCVENRVPMARCCNTGITCAIDAYGKITRTLAPRAAGFTTADIHPRPVELGQTFYTRHPDAFARLALLVSVLLAFVFLFRDRYRF